MKELVLDTSALMTHNNIIKTLSKEYHITIPIVVIEELDNLKTSRDKETANKARNAIRQIEKYQKNISIVVLSILHNKLKTDVDANIIQYNANDNLILSRALLIKDSVGEVYFCTLDLALKIKAIMFDIKVINFQGDIYRGYVKKILTEEEMANFYQDEDKNHFNLKTNQYLMIYNETEECVDTLKWVGDTHEHIDFYTTESSYFDTIKPKDEYQMCALDSLFNNKITALYGKAGTGKSQLSLSYLMGLLDKGKINKIYVVFSFDPLRNAKTLGYEKGSHEEKVLMTGSIGNILATKFGSMEIVKRLILENKLEIIPTANIRGVEFSENSAVFVTEAQNFDVYTLKTVLQRCAGCKQIYEGDIIEQTDVNISQSGMSRMIEVLKDTEYFGCVKLKNNYRNPILDLVDKM